MKTGIVIGLFWALLGLSACGGSERNEATPQNSTVLEFVTPTLGQIIGEGQPLAVEVRVVNGAAIELMDLYIDGKWVGNEDAAPWQWNPAAGDAELQNLPAGTYSLRVVATTTAGDSYANTTTVTVTAAAFRVTGLSLVDVARASTVANFDPIYEGGEVAINLDELGFSEFSFLASHEGTMASVAFSVNGNPFRIDNGAPFALTQNTGAAPLPVTLAPGSYEITAIPYTQINGGGEAGPGSSIRVLIQRSNLQWSTADVLLTSRLNSGEGASAELAVANTGNLAAGIAVMDKPSWLTVTNVGSVAPASQRLLSLRAPACTQPTEQTGTLTLAAAAGPSVAMQVSWSCGERPVFDIALERFYFNQVVPQNDSATGSDGARVDLIAGREGLARAFVTRNNGDNTALPLVELHYRLATGETGVYPLQKSGSLPNSVDESSLSQSFNRLLPATFFQPGTEYFVVVDPAGQINENTTANNRFPASGYQPLTIASPRVMELVFVPLLVPGNPDFTLTNQDVQTLMSTAALFLPIANYAFTIREPASYSGTSWTEALQLINSIRLSEDRNKFYHGIVNGHIGSSNTAGIAQVASNSGLSMPDPGTIAHELGHNLSMNHTDCGGPAGPEPNYPYANARTGNWGYDVRRARLVAPDRADFMSYCYPAWVGSFSFQKMVHYFVDGQSPRGFQFFAPVVDNPTIISGSLHGGVATIDHVYDIEGDFPVTANLLAPYQLKLYDEFGVEIYSTAFEPVELDHSTTLLFDIPVPRELLAYTAWQLKLFYGDELLLAEPWRNQTVLAQSAPLKQQVVRAANDQVDIQWEGSGYTLWVRNADTGRILGMDTTGKISIKTQASTLELTYTKQSQKIIRVVNLP